MCDLSGVSVFCSSPKEPPPPSPVMLEPRAPAELFQPRWKLPWAELEEHN